VNGPTFDVVVPTVGRPSLGVLVDALDALRAMAATPPALERVLVVDDRSAADAPLDLDVANGLPLTVLSTGGAGPAAARNAGWTRGRADWVVFLDDDVVPSPSWFDDLALDLAGAGAGVGGVQGKIVVPVRDGARTDWERNVARLEDADWVTADLAYRRAALDRVGGFDERFPRAYREDSDLALQVIGAGYRIVRGCRTTRHPVAPAHWTVSVRKQAGNADDALMRARYGSDWRARAHTGRTSLPEYGVTCSALLGTVVALARRRHALALALGVAWVARTLRFAARRLRDGRRTSREVATMLVTSALIPPVALAHRIRGEWRTRTDTRRGLPPRSRCTARPVARAVLFDRDGTLVHDVPYNGDPDAVRPVDGARAAVMRLRDAGLNVAVITNQSGIARGLLTWGEVDAVNRRVDRAVGPVDHWFVCPHSDHDGCGCRKPAAGLVHRAAARLGLRPADCVVVGDTAADVEAARAAGARSVLVPNRRTRIEEVRTAPEVAPDLGAAVNRILAR
jgi:histidinol-phosphate phosphatase family protein